MEFPVYLFTGFLESGKTKFIQETLEDKRFNNGDKTLLLICEEGLEEYDFSRFPSKNVFLEIIEDKEAFTSDTLEKLRKKHRATRCILEYNGMWPMQHLYDTMPDGWVIYQQMTFVDSNTILNYNANMRSLVVDKIQNTELVVFNRFNDKINKIELHKLVRALSRRADIAYEYTNGKVDYDDIQDPLPFDIDAPVIEIADNDYALWYRDIMEDLDKYNGKTVKFKGIVAIDNKFEKNTFAIGRHIMTCCVEDITYGGVICKYNQANQLKIRDWIIITAKISIEYSKMYKEKGPILKVIAIEKAEKPEQQVVTF